VSFRLSYNKILMSMTDIIECIGWLINVTDNKDAGWKPEINTVTGLCIRHSTANDLTRISQLYYCNGIISHYSSIEDSLTRIILEFDSHCISKGKGTGKAFPVQAWTCSKGSRRLRLQDF
jgi:hypothetical protein